MKLKVSQRIFLGNALIISLFILVSVILFNTLNDLHENSNWVSHTYKVIEKGNRLLSLMVDQETGMRGFLATGEDKYLEPYNRGKKEFTDLMNELQKTVDDNPSQVELLQEIDDLAKQWDSIAASKYITLRREINSYDGFNNKVLERINSGIGKAKMDALRNSINKIPNINIQNRLVLDLVNMETGLRGYLVTGNQNFLEPYNLGQTNLDKDLRTINNTALTNQAIDWIENYAQVQINDKLSASKFKDRTDLNQLLSRGEGKKYMDKLREDVATFIEREDVLLVDREIAANRSRNLANISLILGALLSAIIGIFATYKISKKITSQVGGEPDEIAKIVEEIASGNLGIKFDDRNSVGIFDSMKNMSSKLKQIIGETKNRTQSLSEIGLTLSSNAEESSATLTQVTSSVNNISNNFNNLLNSVEEVTAAVTQITGNIDSLNSSINQQNTQIAESSSSIEEMVGSIISVTENMNKVYEATGELQKASQTGQNNVNRSNEQIKQVAEESTKLMQTNQLISSIASQTNLLAMNAAIEAAHAGDAGRGFAVVADEIRKLAESTTTQSHGVSEILKHINTLIGEIVDSSEESVESFNKIYNMVKTVNGRTEEVQLAMNEQKAGSEQILESLNTMTRIAETVKGGADEIKNGSNLVMEEVIQLKDTTNDSHVQISEIATSTKEIDEAVVNVRNVSLTNKEMVSSIEDEVSYFSI